MIRARVFAISCEHADDLSKMSIEQADRQGTSVTGTSVTSTSVTAVVRPLQSE
jgi:hypothetical protein